MSRTRAGKTSVWGRVAASVAAAAAVLAALLWVLSSDRATAVVRRLFAVATSAVLNVLGNHTVAQGTEILSSEFGISVVTACTGLFVTGLFLAAVAAFPASWRAHLAGAGIGLAGLFVLNVIRLTSLYYVGRYWPSALDVIHQLVWQSLVIAFAVALWLLWAGRAEPARRRST
jgi:exosortase/archaeosortase family protein